MPTEPGKGNIKYVLLYMRIMTVYKFFSHIDSAIFNAYFAQ